MSETNFTRIFAWLGELINKNRTVRNIVVALSLILLISIVIVLIYAFLTDTSEENKTYLIDNVLPFLLIPLAIIVFSQTAYFAEQISTKTDMELKDIRAKRLEITQKIEEKNNLDIFQTIQLSLNQLNEYYTINKAQAKSSFRFSIFSIVIGLVTIITGIWLYYLDITNIQISYITGASGLILEFIGGAYFFMYKKSLEQVNFFFSQLIKIQDTMLSINLADNIKEVDKRTEIHEKIIISLLERSLK